MGCNASRTAVVAPLQAPSQPPEEDITSSRISLTGSRRSVKVRPRKTQSSDTLRSSSSTATVCSKAECDPDITSLGSRNSSASSGKSKASGDSGDSGLGKDNSIEKSDEPLKDNPNKPCSAFDDDSDNQSIGNDGSQPEKPRPNGQKSVKFAQRLIGELPDSPSILKRPASRGGMAFDVVVEDNLSPRMPLFSSSTKRRKRPSYQELQEKQRVAEQRKKEREQMIIERLKAKDDRDKQVREALDKFAEMQTELANIQQKKEKVTKQNREVYLSSLRDKMHEKSDDKRTAKKLAPANKPPKPNTGKQNNTVNLLH